MADRYVYSGATGSGTGADWANAHTTLAAAVSAASAGDRYFVADDHAETQASNMSISFKGSKQSPDRILCVRRVGGSVPPVAADLRKTATITTTGANYMNLGAQTNYGYMYGLNFYCGTGAVGQNLSFFNNFVVDSCSFNIGNTASTSRIHFGTGGQKAKLRGSTSFSFGHVSQAIDFQFGSVGEWRGDGSPAITGATIPTAFIVTSGTWALDISGVDFSALGSGKTIVSPSSASGGTIRLANCKLNASVTISSTPDNPMIDVQVIACNSSGNVQRNEKYMFGGTLTTETTIVRTGGASDGTTSYSWKIVPNSDNEVDAPVETFEGVIWNDDTGSSKTLTVHVVTDNVTLTDADIWLEVEYLGSSGSPVTARTNDAAAILGTPANQASDSGQAWTTTGLTTPVKQKLECTFTPQLKGLIRWRVCYSKASSTVYVCPKADLA